MENQQLPTVPTAEPIAPEKSNDRRLPVIIAIIVVVILLVVTIIFLVLQNTSKNASSTIEESNQLSLLPSNVCPDRVFEENGQARADLNNKPYSINMDISNWIELNCAGITDGINNSNPDNNTNPSQQNQQTSTQDSTSITKLKSIGINLDYYNPSTNMAGDLAFSPNKLGEYDMPFFDFGFQVQANSAANARKNPQPTFIAPLGTKVYSLIDGVVIDVPKLYSNDYSIHVAASTNSSLIYETEHVINPVVKKGDYVTAGQVIAEVSDYDAHNYNGYGLVEIGILKGGNPPTHICPFEYLDESIKDDVFAKLRNIYKSWNEYRSVTVYNENLSVPGCISTEQVEG